MLVMGIDPSTKTGLVVIGDSKDGNVAESGRLVTFPKQKSWQRLLSIESDVYRSLVLWQPDRVVIEHYSMGLSSVIIQLTEIGSVIRRLLYLLHIPFYEVPPSTLKLWTTGKGNADKPLMGTKVLERWGYKSPSNDIVDGYALARMGHLEHTELMTIKGVKFHPARISTLQPTQGVCHEDV